MFPVYVRCVHGCKISRTSRQHSCAPTATAETPVLSNAGQWQPKTQNLVSGEKPWVFRGAVHWSGRDVDVNVWDEPDLAQHTRVSSAGVEGIRVEDQIQVGICEDDAGLIERTAAQLNDPLLETRCSPPAVLANMLARRGRL